MKTPFRGRCEAFLNRVFRHEEINGGDLCPTYMYRWTLLKLPRGVGLYLHKFVGDDWSRDLHDHPKRFISIGLRGRYIEYHAPRPGGGTLTTDVMRREYRAPWVRTFPAKHTHRIALFPDRKPCWTLVLVLWAERPWGFWSEGRWIFWRDYIGSARANAAKACDD